MADVVIDTGLWSDAYRALQRCGPFWTTPLIGYVIFFDSSVDLAYRKTTDGGATWGSKVIISSNTIIYPDAFADWQVAGDAGTKIHIAYADLTDEEIKYIYLDTSDDSIGGEDTIEACQGTGTLLGIPNRVNYCVTITKSRGGNLGVAFRYKDSNSTSFSGFYTSPDAAVWTSKSDPNEAVGDHFLLYPANLADSDDLWMLYYDRTADELSLKTFDESGNSWSEDVIGNGSGNTSYTQFDGQVRLSDGHLIVATWNDFDVAGADLKVWDITDGGTITAKTNIITDEAESFLATVFIDQTNDDIYVTYVSGTAAESLVKVFYQKSIDGGANWGGEQAMQANAEDDERWISSGCMKVAWGGMFLPIWLNDDLEDLFCNTDNAVSIAAVAGIAYVLNLSDTMVISDSIVKAVGKPVADTVIIGDNITKAIGLVKAETVTISDAIVKAIGIFKTETMTIVDSAKLAYPIRRAVALGRLVMNRLRPGRLPSTEIHDPEV